MAKELEDYGSDGTEHTDIIEGGVVLSEAMQAQLAQLRHSYTANHDQPGVDEETKQADLHELARQERILLAPHDVAKTAFSNPITRLLRGR